MFCNKCGYLKEFCKCLEIMKSKSKQIRKKKKLPRFDPNWQGGYKWNKRR